MIWGKGNAKGVIGMHAWIDEIIILIRSSIVITTFSAPPYQISKKQWKQQDWAKKQSIWIERMSTDLKSGRSREAPGKFNTCLLSIYC